METTKLTTRGIINRTIILLRANIQLAAASFVILTGCSIGVEFLPEEAAIGLAFVSTAVLIYFQTVATKSAISKSSPILKGIDPVGGFVSVLMVIIVSGLGILAGLVVLVIPAIILAARWSIAVPIVVTSDQDVLAAIKSSWQLTKPHTFPITGALLIVVFPLIAFEGVYVFDELTGIGFTSSYLGFAVIQSTINILTVASWYVAVAIFEQVGGTSDTLTEIFA
jgi:membrane-anchored glycerophosphoryl diester phosphodiesterase (GDPDase)